jgi:hypothetical protein
MGEHMWLKKTRNVKLEGKDKEEGEGSTQNRILRSAEA